MAAKNKNNILPHCCFMIESERDLNIKQRRRLYGMAYLRQIAVPGEKKQGTDNREH